MTTAHVTEHRHRGNRWPWPAACGYDRDRPSGPRFPARATGPADRGRPRTGWPTGRIRDLDRDGQHRVRDLAIRHRQIQRDVPDRVTSHVGPCSRADAGRRGVTALPRRRGMGHARRAWVHPARPRKRSQLHELPTNPIGPGPVYRCRGTWGRRPSRRVRRPGGIRSSRWARSTGTSGTPSRGTRVRPSKLNWSRKDARVVQVP